MTRLRLEAVECFERDVRLRLPFRFGVITVSHATQAVIRATIALEDGRTSTGVAAETLGAKWFDKSPAFDDDQNLDQLRQSLVLAIDLYRGRGWSTPFGLYAGTYVAILWLAAFTVRHFGWFTLPPLAIFLGISTFILSFAATVILAAAAARARGYRLVWGRPPRCSNGF